MYLLTLAEKDELTRTLLSLHQQAQSMPQTEMVVCIIQDGWHKASGSFQQYAYDMFGQAALQEKARIPLCSHHSAHTINPRYLFTA